MAILNYPSHSKDYYTQLAVDLFAYSYFMGGINFADIAYLTMKNITGNRLIYTQRKTKQLINLPMQSKAMELINKYKSDNQYYIFPILSSFHQTE